MISLGPVIFQAFEIPGEIRFGGSQRLVVHALPGGGRIIETLGRDDDDIVWSGILSGPDAADRARLLDTMRVGGQVLSLIWDAFSHQVVIARLTLSFRNPWWIPYRISCRVEQPVPVGSASTDLASAILGDVASAAVFTSMSAVDAALAPSGAMTLGTAEYAASVSAFSVSLTGISAGIAGAATQLSAPDIPTLVQATGSLAQLAAAQAYTARAASNLANASS